MREEHGELKLRQLHGDLWQTSEQAGTAQTGHWIDYGQCFPLEEPAGHRKTECRVADVKKLHKSPPRLATSLLPTGEPNH